MKQIAILTIWLAAAGAAFAQETTPSPERIRETVNYLASDKLKGRGTETKGGEKAAGYVEKQFRQIGLLPAVGGQYFQQFVFARGKHYNLHSKNVIGYIDNGAARTVIIGAHYDHLGHGELFNGRYPNEIHNGADDNASGVAGLLELARHYQQNNVKEPFNFVFIAFGGEELGLHGSKYYTRYPLDSLNKVQFMLNMDMIGRYNAQRGVGIGGYGTAKEWPEIFKGVQDGGIKFFTDGSGKGGSDHHSFYIAGVPVLFLHTGGHDDYHKPTDDAPKVDANAEAGILKIAIQLIDNAMKFDRLTYVTQD
ncbi:M20/M25/M40 family metallo-hydrolase [Chitinophaga caseinilytica]|uniref:M20/M25/M40 family metallo-hydrolase n=1 Tax=Chitinophaga caseinilytica TaxID=2267521 RepID=A0ABZ2ZAN5_9BACT